MLRDRRTETQTKRGRAKETASTLRAPESNNLRQTVLNFRIQNSNSFSPQKGPEEEETEKEAEETTQQRRLAGSIITGTTETTKYNYTTILRQILGPSQ